MRILAGVLLVAALAACRSSSAPADDVVTVTVPAAEYAPRATIPYVVRNRGTSPVYLAACGHQPAVVVDRRLGPVWGPFGDGSFCSLADLSVPIRLAPDAEISATYAIRDPGTYALRVTPMRGPDPAPVVVPSSAFVVR